MVSKMRGRVDQSKTGKSLLVSFHEGYSNYTVTVPMPYAVRLFAQGLLSAMRALEQQENPNNGFMEGEKEEVFEFLTESVSIYDRVLKKTKG